MKTHIYNQIEVSCDNCFNSEIYPSMPYAALNKELKQDGWIVVEDGEWLDFCCEDCQKASKDK